MKGWCTQWANEKLPSAIFDPDYRLIVSDDDLMKIYDKALELPTAEQMINFLTKWKWGLQGLESLLRALVEAREAVHVAKSTRRIRERLQDWPWQRVDLSKLKKVLKEDQEDDDIGTGEESEGTDSRPVTKRPRKVTRKPPEDRQRKVAQPSKKQPARLRKSIRASHDDGVQLHDLTSEPEPDFNTDSDAIYSAVSPVSNYSNGRTKELPKEKPLRRSTRPTKCQLPKRYRALLGNGT